MHAVEHQLAEAFARTACEALVRQIGIERAYREVLSLFAAADEETRQMYREIIAVMDASNPVPGLKK